MYLDFFGFLKKPFSLLPDTSFLYLGETHKLALDLLEYGLTEQAGFVVITGEIGCGKTLLIQQVIKNVPDELTVGTVSNTYPGFSDTMRWVASTFGLYEKGQDTVEVYENFVAFLFQQERAGRRVALIVDEAQNLDTSALEELRMLSNINNADDFLLQIVLVGQPNLVDNLNDPNLTQFVQRIGVHFDIRPLTSEDTFAYIKHRLVVAGGAADTFDREACAAVYYFSKGIPRLINMISDLSLVVSYANNRDVVGIDAVLGVARQRDRGGLRTLKGDRASFDDARREILQLARSEPIPEGSSVDIA